MEKAKEFQKNIYFCSLSMRKSLTMWSQQTWKFLKRWEYQTISLVSWETCMCVKKQQLEPETEKLTGSNLEKGYNKALYCHPAYLT